MRVQDLLESLDDRYPLTRAAPWDPVGLQIGDPDADVGLVGVCHEITEAVVGVAVERKVATLVSYHPLLFEPTNRLIVGPTAEGRAVRLIRADTSVIVLHTAMDAAPRGTADELLAALGMEASDRIAFTSDDPASAIGRTVELPSPMDPTVFVESIRAVTGAAGVRTTHPPASISSVAVIPGSGGSLLMDTVDVVDAVVTGDVRHHDAIGAADRGVFVVDAGHAATERAGVEALYAEVCSVVAGAVWLDDDPTPWEV